MLLTPSNFKLLPIAHIPVTFKAFIKTPVLNYLGITKTTHQKINFFQLNPYKTKVLRSSFKEML